MTDEYVPTHYMFECYHLRDGDGHGHRETWALRIPVSELRPEDLGCYMSIEDPMKILAGEHRWGILQYLGPGRAIPEENRLERLIGIDGVDHHLDGFREVFIGSRPGGPDHFKKGGVIR